MWSWSGVIIEKINGMDDLRISNLAISGSYGGLRFHNNGVVKVHNCRFSNNEWGLQLLSESANVTVSDSVFHNNNYGIDVVDRGVFAIHRCQFTKHHKAAIRTSQSTPRQIPETVYISDNAFADNNHPVYMSLSRRTKLRFLRNKFENDTGYLRLLLWENELTVEGNVFLRSSYMSIGAIFSRSVVTIKGNTWKYCDSAISISGYINNQTITTIEHNVFHSNNDGVIYVSGSTTNIILNDFTENTGSTVISYGYRNTKPLEVFGNTFSMNDVSVGVIHSTVPSVIHYNTFDNPKSSHDLSVGNFVIDGVLVRNGRTGFSNVTYNWWGVATGGGVAKRIRVESEPYGGKHEVQWEPFLSKPPKISCADVGNCSSHGECVLPDTCKCHLGWTGSRCSQFSCSEVRQCHGKGECVGPNTCRCEDGWLPPDCAQPTCYNVNNCSGRGDCIAPNRYCGQMTI